MRQPLRLHQLAPGDRFTFLGGHRAGVWEFIEYRPAKRLSFDDLALLASMGLGRPDPEGAHVCRLYEPNVGEFGRVTLSRFAGWRPVERAA